MTRPRHGHGRRRSTAAWPVALLVASTLGALGCEPTPAAGGCAVDKDCPSERHCVAGVCILRRNDPLDAGFFDASKDAEPGPDQDAEVMDASSPSDVGPSDADPTDAAAADTGLAADAAPLADSGAPADSGTPDARPSDSGPADAGSTDASPADAGPPDAGSADAGAGPVARGVYAFRRILVPQLASNRVLTRAVVTPDDQTLVVSGRYNDLFVIDRAAETLRASHALPSAGAGRIQRIDAIATEPAGTHVLIAATVLDAGSVVEGRLYRLSLPGTSPIVQVGAAQTGVTFQSVAIDPINGDIYVVGFREVSGAYWVTVYTYDPILMTITSLGQQFVSAGCQDGGVVADGLGGRGVAYVCGVNGGALGIRDSTGVFVSGPNTGNTAHLAARPQADYALFVSWSGGRLGRFEQGSWTAGFSAPSLNTSRAWNIQFNDDGTRAIVTGQLSGSVGTLREYRHDLFSSADLTDVSIPAFTTAPYLATSGVNLDDAAWRPGSDCGYLVGGCDSPSCTRGYLIGFTVQNGRACP